MNNFSREYRKFTPQEIENVYNSIDFAKYAGKKFVLGDYTFYGFSSEEYIDKYSKEQSNYGHAFYMDYHGFRLRALKFEHKKYEQDYYGKKNSCYNKSFEGWIFKI